MSFTNGNDISYRRACKVNVEKRVGRRTHNNGWILQHWIKNNAIMEYNTMNVKCVCLFEKKRMVWCGVVVDDHDDCSLFSKLNSMRWVGTDDYTKTMDDDGITKTAADVYLVMARWHGRHYQHWKKLLSRHT